MMSDQTVLIRPDDPQTCCGLTASNILKILVVIFIARGLALICLLPPFEMWDEYSHAAYVDYWSNSGRSAIYGQTDVIPVFLTAANHFPQPAGSGFGKSYSDFWACASVPQPPPLRGLYEAQHPFFYYAISSPMYSAFGGRSNLPASISALRLTNLGYGTIAIALILRWLFRNVDNRRAIILGSWVALHPLLLLNVVRVANDALAFLLGTVVVILLLKVNSSRLWLRSGALAIILPLAIFAKFTNATLLPVVAFAFVLAVARQSIRALPAALAATSIALVTSIILAPYILFNLYTFGLVTPMQEAVANRGAGRSLLTLVTAVPIWRYAVWTGSWWVINGLWVGGWSFLYPHRFFEIAYGLFLSSSILAILSRWRNVRLVPDAFWIALAAVVFVHVGLTLHAIEAYSAWSGLVSTNPWYAAVAIPWCLILIGSGGFAISSRRLRVVALTGPPILFLLVESFGTVQMLRLYYSSTNFMTCFTRMATLHPLWLGPMTWVIGCLIAFSLFLMIFPGMVPAAADSAS